MELRTWGRRAERRLARLVRLVEELAAEHGADAAREAVPAFAGVESVPALAAAMGEDRSALSLCLAGQGTYYRLRRRLDDHLDLPPGGMERVLALIEEVQRATH